MEELHRGSGDASVERGDGGRAYSGRNACSVSINPWSGEMAGEPTPDVPHAVFYVVGSMWWFVLGLDGTRWSTSLLASRLRFVAGSLPRASSRRSAGAPVDARRYCRDASYGRLGAYMRWRGSIYFPWHRHDMGSCGRSSWGNILRSRCLPAGRAVLSDATGNGYWLTCFPYVSHQVADDNMAGKVWPRQ